MTVCAATLALAACSSSTHAAPTAPMPTGTKATAVRSSPDTGGSPTAGIRSSTGKAAPTTTTAGPVSSPPRTHAPPPSPTRTRTVTPTPTPVRTPSAPRTTRGTADSGVLKAPSGNFYAAGEYCPDKDKGLSTRDVDGNTLTCVMESGRYHWHHN